MFKRFALTAVGLMIATAAQAAEPADTLTMELKDNGKVTIELRPDLAPNHAERLRTLADKGFYDGVVFHRVIEGFMVQTGDPTGTGMGGSDLPDLKAEFTQEPFVRGTVGMARSGDPDSANSQFFICYNDTGCSSLQGSYTVVGKVTDGMDNIDKVKQGNPADNGKVSDPDKIVKLRSGAAK